MSAFASAKQTLTLSGGSSYTYYSLPSLQESVNPDIANFFIKRMLVPVQAVAEKTFNRITTKLTWG